MHSLVMINRLYFLFLALYTGTFVLGYESTVTSRKRDCALPNLIDATFDELHSGLEGGCFTSVDLVLVSYPLLLFHLISFQFGFCCD